MPSLIRAVGLCAFLFIPFLAGCSTAGDGAAPLALGDGAASAEADADVVSNSLAAEQDAEISGVTALVTPSPRPGREAAAAVNVAAYADPGGGKPAAMTALEESGKARPVAARSPELDALIARYAAHYEIPERLVRRVVKRESNFDPSARNRIYWGLMQIRHDTAQTMGYRGPASGLLDAETNLKYAVKYLRGAYITAGGNEDRAVRFYASGYYYDAKAKGLLRETGLRN
ncbi:lytic transglycosylase domain-containing protein [Chelativorans sp. AA-79]|uniref:lytic transglycosylase domain-containing protein n=1 Tax=Chelativorans sp. AA-79 TaxID=3028735 RepID=UPI0023F82606|nr:lytic transglycosylase domain-containing protein [Chelativorans sp. AA-79]WEX11206.1 lytic transglycosylase domain-containing protein [Chelativorans sp. AA-79]